MTTSAERQRVSLGPGDRVAVIAGSGRLPVDVASGLEELGQKPFVVLLDGEADGTELAGYETVRIPLENFAAVLPVLKQRGTTHVVMAGGIARRPELRRLRPSWALLTILPQVMRALRAGDDGLLAKAVRILEGRGLTVLGAHEVVPDLLAQEGRMGALDPLPADRRDLDAAFAAAHAIGALDIGQAAVAVGGRVVALEGIEGTDDMLARVKTLRAHGRIAGVRRGVLVKCAKPGQELRADLPAIGPATVLGAHAAGLAGIGVEAGRALVLDQMEVVRQADALGLFVVGLPPRGGAG